MARAVRRKLKFDEESVNSLLQEIYDQSHNINAKIARLFTKWETKVKEGGEIAALGDSIVKLISAEAKNQDQKIVLLRYLKEVVFDKKGVDNNDTKETEVVSTDRRNELLEMVEREINNKKNY